MFLSCYCAKYHIHTYSVHKYIARMQILRKKEKLLDYLNVSEFTNLTDYKQKHTSLVLL